MNSIAPHSPPIPTSPGQLPTGGGGGKKQDDTSFDDVLSGVPMKGLPSPIEDHSPPPTIDDSSPSDDPTSVPLPRPMRWKGGKGPATDAAGPAASAGVPLLPAQPDLRSMVPAVTPSADWVRPTATPDNAEGTTIDPSSTKQDGASGIAASDARGSTPSFGSYPVTSSRLTPMPASTYAGTPTGPADHSPPKDPTVSQASASEKPAASLRESNPPTAYQPVMSSQLNFLAISGSERMIPGAVLPGGSATPSDAASDPTSTEPAMASPASGADAATIVPTENNPANLLAQPAALPTRISSVPIEGPIASNGRSDVAFSPVKGATPVPVKHPPIVSPGMTPKADYAAPSRAAETELTDSRQDGSTPAVVSAPGTRVELSAPSKTEEAKIAALKGAEALQVPNSKGLEMQVSEKEKVMSDDSGDGTSVAKDAEVVNATLSNNEKATEFSPLPKRGGGVSSGLVTTGHHATGSTTGRQIYTDVPVSGVTEPATTAGQITTTPIPEPTAARQAVKVETLLQNALNAGEGLRPSGQDHMEMRVRLGGGSEDVTVRLQVANDRMQVTFQTNSPEMRKALEHGWEQFSTAAAHTSTLGLAAPRFETAPASVATQGQSTDAQGFSFDQQNSRRQESPATAFEDGGPTTGSRRSELPTTASNSPASGSQATTRRWSGWA